jgi:hypothetical protein
MIVPVPGQSHGKPEDTLKSPVCSRQCCKSFIGERLSGDFPSIHFFDPLMLADREEYGIIGRVVMDRHLQGPFMPHEMILT